MNHKQFNFKSKHDFTKALNMISEQLLLIEETMMTIPKNKLNND